MNFGEMITQVRLLLGETDSDNSYYTDAEIQTQINIGIQRVASDLRTLMTYKELTVADGTQRYGLPVDFMQLKDVQYTPSGTTRRIQLEGLTYDEFEAVSCGNTDMEGQPAYFRVEFGATSTTSGSAPGDLWLYPIPDNASDTLRIVYYQKPSALSTSAEVSELPEWTHDVVCYHSAWHMSLKDDNQSKINNLAAMYKDGINEAKKTANRRDRSGPTFIKSPYGGSSLIKHGGFQARRGPLR